MVFGGYLRGKVIQNSGTQFRRLYVNLWTANADRYSIGAAWICAISTATVSPTPLPNACCIASSTMK